MIPNPLNPYQTPDEFLLQTWQPRFDTLNQRLQELVDKASSISRSQTQRFLWGQALTLGFGDETAYTLVAMLGNPQDNALFDEMLDTLANSPYPPEVKQRLAFSILMSSSSSNYDDAGKPIANQTFTPRQQRIRQFLEEQFQHETAPLILGAYLDIYYSLSQESPTLIPADQFWQQLETLRTQLTPDTYYRYRLQKLNLAGADADYADLLQEISTSPMTPQQRQDTVFALNSQVAMQFSPGFDGAAKLVAMPEQQRHLLQHYLENNLPTPDAQDRYSLFQYGEQTYTIELLRDQNKAGDAFYQKIINSNSPLEQLALLLGTPVSNENILQRLRENMPLRQKLDTLLQQPNLTPEMRRLLEEGVGMLKSEPYGGEQPAQSEQGVDEYGRSIYTLQTFTADGARPDSGSAPDTSPTDGQYPGY